MPVKMLSGAAVLALLMAGSAGAEGLGGPSSLPPPGFKGQQFVDSRGCLFLRAGSGAKVNWVARIDRNHKPICGMTAGAAVQSAPAPQTVAVAVPAAPPGQTVAVVQPAPIAAQPTLPKPPKGWVLAWKDDRLNPLRARGSAEGQAEQDRVWTRSVPMVLVADHPQQAARKTGMRITVSTMSAPQASGGLVQVGAFADPANATRVIARLTAAGLPVSSSPMTRQGKTLQVVFAGPFPSAQAGLRAVRGAGFPEAILR